MEKKYLLETKMLLGRHRMSVELIFQVAYANHAKAT